MKWLAIIVTFILAVSLSYYTGWKTAIAKIFSTNEPTTVYIVKEKLTLENGAIIPKGTELMFDTRRPEGFRRLKLYINTDSTDLFSIHLDERTNLIKPYWVDGETHTQLVEIIGD